MASVVNLRLARKRKARAAEQHTAAENRALHGRTKAEKLRDSSAIEKSLAFIEGHHRQPLGDKGKA